MKNYQLASNGYGELILRMFFNYFFFLWLKKARIGEVLHPCGSSISPI